MFIFFAFAIALGIVIAIFALLLLVALVWGLLSLILWLASGVAGIWASITGKAN